MKYIAFVKRNSVEERHDSLWALFVEGVEQETNAELQEIAEEQKSAQLTVELDYFLFGV
jgi:hypothetical protein